MSDGNPCPTTTDTKENLKRPDEDEFQLNLWFDTSVASLQHWFCRIFFIKKREEILWNPGCCHVFLIAVDGRGGEGL